MFCLGSVGLFVGVVVMFCYGCLFIGGVMMVVGMVYLFSDGFMVSSNGVVVGLTWVCGI